LVEDLEVEVGGPCEVPYVENSGPFRPWGDDSLDLEERWLVDGLEA